MSDQSADLIAEAEDNPQDFRAKVVRGLSRAAEDPGRVVSVVSMIGDRLEGQPTKTVVSQKQRVTVIVEEGRPLPRDLQEMFGEDSEKVPKSIVASGDEAEGPVRTEDGYEEVTSPPPPGEGS